MLNIRSLGLLAAVVLLAAPMHAQKKPALADLLRLAADYHASYGPRISGVTLEERYTLIQVHAGRMGVPVRFSSDVVLVNVGGRIIGMRDPFAVDNVALRERLPRITSLLAEPTTDAWLKAQEYQHQSDFRFLADIILQMNDPTLALQILSAGMQPRFTFKLEGTKKINGVQTQSVRFDENGGDETKLMLGTGGNARASGRFFIDPATGAVHKSELWADSKTENVRVNVTYAPHAALGVLLPEKGSETYEWKELDDVASNRSVGAYGARLFFQASAEYSNIRHTPIDLSKARH